MIDPNEAPEGFEAIAPPAMGNCAGCHFLTLSCETIPGLHCAARFRKDKHAIVFKKRTA